MKKGSQPSVFFQLAGPDSPRPPELGALPEVPPIAGNLSALIHSKPGTASNGCGHPGLEFSAPGPRKQSMISTAKIETAAVSKAQRGRFSAFSERLGVFLANGAPTPGASPRFLKSDISRCRAFPRAQFPQFKASRSSAELGVSLQQLV